MHEHACAAVSWQIENMLRDFRHLFSVGDVRDLEQAHELISGVFNSVTAAKGKNTKSFIEGGLQ